MKQRFRSLLAGFLCVLFLMTLLPNVSTIAQGASNSGQCGPELTWSFQSSTGTLRISGKGEMTVYSSVHSIPWRSLGTRVYTLQIDEGITTISEDAFSYFENITTLKLPDSLLTVGKSAFSYCTGLKTVTFGKNLQTIGTFAFERCKSLTNLTFPGSLKEIQYGAFCECTSLTALTIPGTLRHIGDHAFIMCTNLKTLHLSEGVESIGEMAFTNTSLQTVILPGSLSTLGDGAFSDCPNLTAITVDKDHPAFYSDKNGFLFNKEKTKLLQIPAAATGYVSVPGTVTAIGAYAFSGCSRLVGASLPEGLTEISDYGFYGWTGVRHLTIPESVDRIGVFAFGYCANLRTVKLPTSLSKLERLAFYNCENLVEVSVPDGITFLERSLFSGCKNLCSLTISAGTTNDGDVYAQCDNLKHFLFLGYWSHWDAFRNQIPFGLRNNAIAHTHIDVNNQITRDSVYWDYTSTGKSLYCTHCGKSLKDLAFQAADNPFQDVPTTDYTFIPTLWALEKGITTGTSKDRFAPDQECTRGQIVTFLWRAFGSPEPESTENPFADVAPSAYYYKAVLWAVEKGITTGMSQDTFAPDKSCTRGQAVTFLWRAKGQTETDSSQNPFQDVKASDFFYAPVLWALEEGITTGVSATAFAPGRVCTRGQIVTFLFRTMEGT